MRLMMVVMMMMMMMTMVFVGNNAHSLCTFREQRYIAKGWSVGYSFFAVLMENPVENRYEIVFFNCVSLRDSQPVR
jgi:hypothetical protein